MDCSFALGTAVRPAEGHYRREAGCAGRYGVCRAARVGARVRAAGEATCRATYIPSPLVPMGDSSPKMPMVTFSSPLDAQAELQG